MYIKGFLICLVTFLVATILYYVDSLNNEIETLKAQNAVSEAEVSKLNSVIDMQNQSIKDLAVDSQKLQRKLDNIKKKAKKEYQKVDVNQSCEKILEDKLKIFLESIK